MSNFKSFWNDSKMYKRCNVHVSITLRCVRVNNLQRKGNNYYVFMVCVCRICYPARKARTPYCHSWPVRLCHMFFTLSHKRNFFCEDYRIKTRVLIFLYKFVCNIFYPKKK